MTIGSSGNITDPFPLLRADYTCNVDYFSYLSNNIIFSVQRDIRITFSDEPRRILRSKLCPPSWMVWPRQMYFCTTLIVVEFRVTGLGLTGMYACYALL